MGEYFQGIVMGAAISMATFLGGLVYHNHNVNSNTIDTPMKCILPGELETRCVDLDGDGKKDPIIKLRNNSYLFKKVDGISLLVPYSSKRTQ